MNSTLAAHNWASRLPSDTPALHSLPSLDAFHHVLEGSRAFNEPTSMNIGEPERDWSTASEASGLGPGPQRQLHGDSLDRQVSLGTALQQAIANANKPKTIEETWRDIQQHHAAEPSNPAPSSSANFVKPEGNYAGNPQWRGVPSAPGFGGGPYPGVPPMGVAPAGLNSGLLEEILRNQRMAAFAAAAAVNASQGGNQRQANGPPQQVYDAGIPPKSPHATLPAAYLPPRPDYANGANGDFASFQMRNAYLPQARQLSPRSGDNAQNPILVNNQGLPGDRLALSPRGAPNGHHGAGFVMPKHDPDAEDDDEDDDPSPRERARKRVRIHEVEKDSKIEKRTLRMIKNRESAARSRLRKQAYTQSLEAEINELKEENTRLKRQKETLGAKQSPEAKVSTMNRLRRTRTGPW